MDEEASSSAEEEVCLLAESDFQRCRQVPAQPEKYIFELIMLLIKVSMIKV